MRDWIRGGIRDGIIGDGIRGVGSERWGQRLDKIRKKGKHPLTLTVFPDHVNGTNCR
jgi:hypothetical protein